MGCKRPIWRSDTPFGFVQCPQGRGFSTDFQSVPHNQEALHSFVTFCSGRSNPVRTLTTTNVTVISTKSLTRHSDYQSGLANGGRFMDSAWPDRDNTCHLQNDFPERVFS